MGIDNKTVRTCAPSVYKCSLLSNTQKTKWLEIAITSLQIEPHSCQYPIINHLDEIQGPLNEWTETRLKLVQENGEKIWFEAVTSEDSTLGKEHKKLNFTH
jgi:hypothetical protein